MKRNKILIILSTILVTACALSVLTSCGDDIDLNLDGYYNIVYDPMGGLWSVGNNSISRTVYAQNGSPLPESYDKYHSDMSNNFPTVRRQGYTLLGWYTKYSEVNYIRDDDGGYVDYYNFTENKDGNYKITYFYLEYSEGDFVAKKGATYDEDQAVAYELYDENVSYDEVTYVGAEGVLFKVSRYKRIEVYSLYNASEDGEVTRYSAEKAYVVYDEDNPSYEELDRYEAYYTFDAADKWNFSTSTVSGEMTLYASWEKSIKVIWEGIDMTWINGENKVTLVRGQKIDKTSIEPIETGKTFVGWYKDKDCTKPWDFDVDVYPENINITTLFLYSKMLEGKWTVISKVSDLSKVGTNLSGNYFLSRNIDLGGADNPLGIGANQIFTGKFDGNGYTLGNFNVSAYKTSVSIGFFSIISGAEISNLTLQYTINLSSVIAGPLTVGGISGGVSGNISKITNCNVTVNITGSLRSNLTVYYSGCVGSEVSLNGSAIQIVGKSGNLVLKNNNTSNVSTEELSNANLINNDI